MAVLLTCDAIEKHFDSRTVFSNISLSLHDGERLGVIGPNGAGKSTFLQILAGLMPPDEGAVSVRKGVRMALVPQDPRFDPAATQVRTELNLENRFLICYIGTMGMAHGLETLVAAAERLQTALPAATFLLIGEGSEKQRIAELAATRGLTNIRFLGQQPRERIPTYISAADVCLVILKKTELFKTVIPTKLLEYMACERPVIVAVDGQARRIVEAANAGLFVEPEDSEAIVQAILNLAADAQRRQRMGAGGREYIVRQLSRERTARTYLTVLSELIGANKRVGR